MEDSTLSEDWLTVTGEAIMSRFLLPLCVSAGKTTRPLNAAVEQEDTHTHTHTQTQTRARMHACMQTHAHTHQAYSPKQTTAQHVAGCFLPLSFITLCCRCGQFAHEHAHRRL